MAAPPPPLGRFDDALLALAARHDGLHDLLRTLFSFLHRRTDLYVVDDSPERPMGFEAGAAERILLSAFRSFPYKDPRGQPMARGEARQRAAAAPTTAAAAAAPRSSADVPAASANDASSRLAGVAAAAPVRPAGGASSSSAAAATAPTAPPHAPASTVPAPTAAPPPPPSAAAPPSIPTATPAVTHVGPPSSSSSSSSTSALERIRYTDAGLQIPVASGGVGPGYWWSQSLAEVTVHVDVPAGVRARDVVCDVTPQRLRVTVPASTATGRASTPAARLTLLEGPLYAEVRPGECLWMLEPAGADGGGVTVARPVDPSLPGGAGMPPCDRPSWPAAAGGGDGGGGDDSGGAASGVHGSGLLTVTLGKVVHTWWRRVVVADGHPAIDATRVDSSQAVSEYDEETQAAIRKIVFDQAQAARGLPGSVELAAQALLRRAARAPGSPFTEPEGGVGGGGQG